MKAVEIIIVAVTLFVLLFAFLILYSGNRKSVYDKAFKECSTQVKSEIQEKWETYPKGERGEINNAYAFQALQDMSVMKDKMIMCLKVKGISDQEIEAFGDF